jgi:hypothetical protein
MGTGHEPVSLSVRRTSGPSITKNDHNLFQRGAAFWRGLAAIDTCRATGGSEIDDCRSGSGAIVSTEGPCT